MADLPAMKWGRHNRPTAPSFTLKSTRFEDLDEFVGFVEARKQDRLSIAGQEINFLLGSKHNKGDGVTYAEASRMLTRGWPEGVLAAAGALGSLESKITHGRRAEIKSEYAVAGGYPDIGVALTGDPECFLVRRVEREFGHGKILRMRVCLGGGWDISPSRFLLRGICILAAIEAIEKAGISLEVDAVLCLVNERGKRMHEIDIPLKASDRVCDDDRLAFCLGHAAFVRRWGYRAAHQMIGGDELAFCAAWTDFSPMPGDITFPPLVLPQGDSENPWEDDDYLIAQHLAVIEKAFSLK